MGKKRGPTAARHGWQWWYPLAGRIMPKCGSHELTQWARRQDQHRRGKIGIEADLPIQEQLAV